MDSPSWRKSSSRSRSRRQRGVVQAVSLSTLLLFRRESTEQADGRNDATPVRQCETRWAGLRALFANRVRERRDDATTPPPLVHPQTQGGIARAREADLRSIQRRSWRRESYPKSTGGGGYALVNDPGLNRTPPRESDGWPRFKSRRADPVQMRSLSPVRIHSPRAQSACAFLRADARRRIGAARSMSAKINLLPPLAKLPNGCPHMTRVVWIHAQEEPQHPSVKYTLPLPLQSPVGRLLAKWLDHNLQSEDVVLHRDNGSAVESSTAFHVLRRECGCAPPRRTTCRARSPTTTEDEERLPGSRR